MSFDEKSLLKQLDKLFDEDKFAEIEQEIRKLPRNELSTELRFRLISALNNQKKLVEALAEVLLTVGAVDFLGVPSAQGAGDTDIDIRRSARGADRNAHLRIAEAIIDVLRGKILRAAVAAFIAHLTNPPPLL